MRWEQSLGWRNESIFPKVEIGLKEVGEASLDVLKTVARHIGHVLSHQPTEAPDHMSDHYRAPEAPRDHVVDERNMVDTLPVTEQLVFGWFHDSHMDEWYS